MRKCFTLQGLCCPVCADKIEKGALKLQGVTESRLSFMQAKMVVEVDESSAQALKPALQKLVKSIEPKCVLEERG